MRVHYLQHVNFEGLSIIEAWLLNNDHEVSSTLLYGAAQLPAVQDFDWLIVMGGPMSTYDTDQYPWLESETALIRQAIAAGKRVLGICLGAQLIAQALGARVYPNQYREIGWHKVNFLPQPQVSRFHNIFDQQQEVFHWHSDTFDLPSTAVLFASNPICQNQAFVIDDRVVGLQFHLEASEKTVQSLVENCGEDLDDSPYVQSPEQMLTKPERFKSSHQLLFKLLHTLSS